MSIATEPAFPTNMAHDSDGMTYRQWLIGQTMHTPALYAYCSDPEGSIREAAALAIKLADAVLDLLEKEQQPPTNTGPITEF